MSEASTKLYIAEEKMEDKIAEGTERKAQQVFALMKLGYRLLV